MSLAVSRILVPTDFSPCAERALDVGLYLARRYNAKVVLLHVTELAPDYSGYPGFFAPDPRVASHQADQASKQSLEGTLSAVKTDGVAVLSASVRGLFAAETICDYADYRGVDLVVIGTHGRRGIRRLLYECAPMAMLIEQAGGTATTGRERILDVQPTDLHMRVPIVLGNRGDIERYESMVRRHDEDQMGVRANVSIRRLGVDLSIPAVMTQPFSQS